MPPVRVVERLGPPVVRRAHREDRHGRRERGDEEALRDGQVAGAQLARRAGRQCAHRDLRAHQGRVALHGAHEPLQAPGQPGVGDVARLLAEAQVRVDRHRDGPQEEEVGTDGAATDRELVVVRDADARRPRPAAPARELHEDERVGLEGEAEGREPRRERRVAQVHARRGLKVLKAHVGRRRRWHDQRGIVDLVHGQRGRVEQQHGRRHAPRQPAAQVANATRSRASSAAAPRPSRTWPRARWW